MKSFEEIVLAAVPWGREKRAVVVEANCEVFLVQEARNNLRTQNESPVKLVVE